MSYPYRVKGIVWAVPRVSVPTEAVVMLSHHIVHSSVEDYEPEEFHDRVDEMDEDDQDEFWNDYEPSDEARAAWELGWDSEIKEELGLRHGVKVLSFVSYAPAQDEPVTVSVFFAREVQ